MRGFFAAALERIVFDVFVPRVLGFFADLLGLRAGFFLDVTTSTRDYAAP